MPLTNIRYLRSVLLTCILLLKEAAANLTMTSAAYPGYFHGGRNQFAAEIDSIAG